MPARRLVLVLLAAQFLLHAPFLGLPPLGFHLWRQTQTLSVARNLHEEGFDLLHPRVDSRGAGPGIAGMEFPLVNAAIAGGYRLFGFHHALHRSVLLLLSALAVAGMFALGRGLLGSNRAGFAAGAMLVLNPLFAYYSITALPDAAMLAFLLPGLAALHAWACSGRSRWLLPGIAGMALAGLVKLSSATAWPVALLFLWQGLRRGSGGGRVLALTGSALALGTLTAWYLWARHLNALYGQTEFLLGLRLSDSFGAARESVARTLFRWLPEVYLSYPQFALALAGLVWVVRRRSPLGWPLALWGTALVAYGVAFLAMLDMHDYYMAPAVPPLCLLATSGLLWLWRSAEGGRGWSYALAAMLALLATIGPFRGLSRFAAAPDRELIAAGPVLDRLLPEPAAPTLVASDASPSIYLYFLHRKGWAVASDVAPERLQALVDAGARYLVSDSRALEARPELAVRLRPLGASGRFRVFAVVPQDPPPGANAR